MKILASSILGGSLLVSTVLGTMMYVDYKNPSDDVEIKEVSTEKEIKKEKNNETSSEKELDFSNLTDEELALIKEKYDLQDSSTEEPTDDEEKQLVVEEIPYNINDFSTWSDDSKAVFYNTEDIWLKYYEKPFFNFLSSTSSRQDFKNNMVQLKTQLQNMDSSKLTDDERKIYIEYKDLLVRTLDDAISLINNNAKYATIAEKSLPFSVDKKALLDKIKFQKSM